MMRDEEYFAIKERAAAQLLTIPHVTAVGIGGRERDGKPTGEVVIKVFVVRKKPASDVPAEELIPASFEGVGTDVVELGPPERIAAVPGAVSPQTMATDDARTDPLRGGMDITVEFNGPAGGGTLGCFLKDKRDGSAIYGLTCHHVVVPAGGKLSRSRRILQRSANDPTKFAPFGIVAAGGDDNKRDAAVIRINPAEQWLPHIKDIGFVKGTHDVTVAEAATLTYQVRKRGAKTRLRGGIVEAIAVQVGAHENKSTFDIVIRPNPGQPASAQSFFGFSGDSGSVVVNDDNEIVGLLYAIEGVIGTQLRVKAFASQIKLVLDRFLKVDRLDLEVAVAGPNPTDASELRTVDEKAGAPLLTPAEILARGDPGYRRPLTGGSQILVEPFLNSLTAATLGAVVVDQTDANQAYILTAYSGVSANGTRPPTTDTNIGQPDNDSSSTGCCSNTVGTFEKGGTPAAPIAALVKLKDDQKWLSELLELGVILNTFTLTAIDVSRGSQLRKYGAGTRQTGGIPVAIGGVAGTLPADVRPDAILIRPNPNPLAPSQDICFSNFVDRGAVVMNNANEVVGLLYDEKEIPGPTGQRVIHGVAMPIHIALDQLNALSGVRVKFIAPATVDEVHVVKLPRTMLNDRDRARVAIVDGAVRPTRDELNALRDELSALPQGRLVMAMWSTHREEVRRLVDRNRRVATVWHRSGGPALLQALIRGVGSPGARFPASINGVPIGACLDRIEGVFRTYGSPALRADISRVRSMLPDLGGGAFTDLVALIRN